MRDGGGPWQREDMARLASALALLALITGAGDIAKDWNDEEIPWRGYEAGLEAAKKAGKPVCLVFYAPWCSGCAAYSKLFHDPKVVKASRDFVMVRVNRDEAEALSKQFDVDGEYIPRTFFLSPEGKLDKEIRRLGQDQAYYYDVERTSALRSGFKWAKRRLHPDGAKKKKKK